MIPILLWPYSAPMPKRLEMVLPVIYNAGTNYIEMCYPISGSEGLGIELNFISLPLCLDKPKVDFPKNLHWDFVEIWLVQVYNINL